jgi:hypothetical protein
MKSLFLRSNSAIAAIEFALIAPVALMILCLALESARFQIASLLIQRSMYDLAYKAKVDPDRGANFEAMAQQVLTTQSHIFFRVEEVKVKVASDPDMRYIRAGGVEGSSGGGQDLVRLTYETELGGLFPYFMPESLKVKKTFHYYYINEPG